MNEADQNYAKMATAIEYLYDHRLEQPSLADVAAAVSLSPTYLQRLFQHWVGLTPKKMLQHLSISHAKTVLQQQGSVLEAAWASGLSGGGRLHDLFIQIEGMTPGEYKQGGAALTMYYHVGETPFGQVLLVATDKGISAVAFVDDVALALAEIQREYPKAQWNERKTALHEHALQYLQTGFGTQALSLHIKASPFQLKVWQALLKIPAGSLSSYGAIADDIGHPKAARAVGTAVANNPVAILIPCHRVIRESGIIGQYRWQRGRKLAILARELAHE